MTVSQFTQPNYTTQSAAQYKANIDASIAALARLAGWFAPHQQDVGSPAPEMSVRLDAGYVLVGRKLIEVAAQDVSGFTTPTAGQTRIDRVVVDAVTGVASRIAGTAAAGSPSATPPNITVGKLPVCSVTITSADTAITNSMITDERAATQGGGAILLASGSSSAVAQLDITAFDSTKFSNYRLLLHHVQPATDVTSLYLRTSTDGGSSFAASGYNWAAFASDTAAASGASGASATAQMILTGSSAMGNQSGETSSYAIELLGMHDTAARTRVVSQAGLVNVTPVFEQIRMTGERSTAEDNNAVRILSSSGNLATIKWSLYGMDGQAT